MDGLTNHNVYDSVVAYPQSCMTQQSRQLRGLRLAGMVTSLVK